MSTSTKHYDLHVTGIGTLYRVRDVEVRKGKPYLAVSLCAIHGDAADKENLTKVWFDCTVPGQEAERLVREMRPAIEAKKHVLISFKIGDLTPEMFTHRKGPKTGQPGISLKARLLFIVWAKVDGVEVYRAPANEYHPADTQETGMTAGEYSGSVAA